MNTVVQFHLNFTATDYNLLRRETAMEKNPELWRGNGAWRRFSHSEDPAPRRLVGGRFEQPSGSQNKLAAITQALRSRGRSH